MVQGLRDRKSTFLEDFLDDKGNFCTIFEEISHVFFDLEGRCVDLPTVGLRDYLDAGQPSDYFTLQLK